MTRECSSFPKPVSWQTRRRQQLPQCHLTQPKVYKKYGGDICPANHPKQTYRHYQSLVCCNEISKQKKKGLVVKLVKPWPKWHNYDRSVSTKRRGGSIACSLKIKTAWWCCSFIGLLKSVLFYLSPCNIVTCFQRIVTNVVTQLQKSSRNYQFRAQQKDTNLRIPPSLKISSTNTVHFERDSF